MEEQNAKTQATKVCKHCQSEIPKKAKICPNCRKKQGGKLKIVVIVIVAIIIIASIAGGGSDSDKPSNSNPKKVNQSDSSENNKENDEKKENEEKIFVPGDVVETSDLRITFVSAGKFKSDNEFLEPPKGKIYYKMEFEFENISDSDKGLSTMMDWTCYADSYKVDQTYVGDDDNGLDATLSKGKKAKGSVYFEVPKESKEIMLEYSPSFWSDDKVVFKAK